MKKYFFIPFLLLGIISFSQEKREKEAGKQTPKTVSYKDFGNGSKITRPDLSKANIENLKNLGLIWGFLKYYHPRVAAGNFNWDNELFKIYPEIEGLPAERRDQAFVAWIRGLGEFKTAKIPEPDHPKMKADLDWITTSGFSKDLTTLLLQVKTAKRKETNSYVSLYPNVKNPDFRNENAYPSMTAPDAGYRLLSLYRYWNIIQYYFPYRYAIGEDWKQVLQEFIPKFSGAEDQKEYTLVCLELAARINDSHASVHNSITRDFFGIKFVPLEIVFAEDKAVVKNYYDETLSPETGLKTGDVIIEVDGKTIEEISKEKSKYLPASNSAARFRDLARILLATNKDQISIKFIREGVTQNVTAKTYTYKEINYTQKLPATFTMLNKDIGYLYMNKVKKEELPGIFSQLKEAKGLVIDLRTYPYNFVVFDVGGFLMTKPEEFAKFSNTSVSSPGNYLIFPGEPVGTNNKDFFKGKVAILINEQSQSSAEYHAMAFRKAPNARVFGSQTAGADGNISYFTLPGKIQTTITGVGVYTPEGSETQRIGIIPDVEVKPTVEGIKNNKDEVLEKALDWIKN